jgi:hypothetical protein
MTPVAEVLRDLLRVTLLQQLPQNETIWEKYMGIGLGTGPFGALASTAAGLKHRRDTPTRVRIARRVRAQLRSIANTSSCIQPPRPDNFYRFAGR